MLRGSDEVPLAPGEAKTVVFEVTRRDISNWNPANRDWAANGKNRFLFVGGSSIYASQCLVRSVEDIVG